MQTAPTREPAVAGSFYPADPGALAAMVDSLLARRSTPAGWPPVRVMVVPHAGYAYSGSVAAHAFALLSCAPSRIARAFIIGPSHVEAFNFASVYDGGAFRTPLGDIRVDEDTAHALTRSRTSIRRGRHGHDFRRDGRGEHAIEVEIPFLQRVAPDACLVPIIMGAQGWDACEELGGALREVIDWNRDVIIASSDLSHFHPDARARELDGEFCARLAALDASLLHARVSAGECEACGAGPVVAALIASEGLTRRECKILSRANSGDVSGDRGSVVGYASAVVTGDAA